MTKEAAIDKLIENSDRFNRMVGILMAWDESKSITENALEIGISFPNALCYRNQFQLNYAPNDKRLIVIGKQKEIKALIKSGKLTLDEIGFKYGISRQRVHQIKKCMDK